MIRAVAIGIPARNEAERIEACVESVIDAAATCGLPTSIVVVADSSDDETAVLARRVLSGAPPTVRTTVLDRAFGRVGPTRDLACRHALAMHAPVPAERIWLATTDADSEVPGDWLDAHLGHHRAGCDGVAGLVALKESDVSAELNAKFRRAISAGGISDGHPHVHGANLGIVGSAFLASGGFSDVSVGEDQELWRQAKAAGYRVRGTTDGVVITSGRRHGRASGGLATFLDQLESTSA